MPPDITGNNSIDTQSLNYWCGGLLTHLKKILSYIEDNNIAYVSADKLTDGNINIDKISLSGTYINITENAVTFSNGETEFLNIKTDENGCSLRISNTDGTRFIYLHDDVLEISADTVTADTITANNIEVTGTVHSDVVKCRYISAGNLSSSDSGGGGGVIA